MIADHDDGILPPAQDECQDCGAPCEPDDHICYTCGFIRLPPHIRVVNCAECRVLLLGPSMTEAHQAMTEVEQDRLPELVYRYVKARPHCRACVKEKEWLRVIAPAAENVPICGVGENAV